MAEKPTDEELKQQIKALEKENDELKRMKDSLERRVEALTQPLKDVGDVAFEDLFRIEDIQRIQDEFATATGLASIITHTDGTPITKPSNFCRLCKDIIRKTEKGLANCFKSDAVVGRFHPEGPIVQQCMSGGLWDAGAGITVFGKHIANWLIGQVRDEAQTENKILEYAREIGADEKEMIEAFREVPAMSHAQFGQVAKVLFILANQLSKIAYQNVQQARFITDRMRAEEALRTSEKKYRLLFEESNDGIFVYDLEGNIVDTNAKAQTMLGYSKNGMNRLMISMLHPESEQEGTGWTIEEFQKKEPANFETRFIKKDGTIIDVDVSTSVVDNQKGLVQGIIRDISERKQLETLIQQTQKMEAIGTLAGGIAHDFNNILSAIFGHAEVALAKATPGTFVHSRLESILKAAERARGLVKQILVFSRQGEQEIMAVEITRSVKEAANFMRASLPSSVEIRHNIKNAPTVLGDPTAIHQVIMNLCTNAGQAMHDSGGVLEIGLETMELDSEFTDRHPGLKPGAHIKLTVSDTGCGMPPQLVKRIFDPFFTTKDRGQGTGMGLSVVHGIVKKHGGIITVYSSPGKGSVFNVFLPAVERRSDQEVRPEKILLVGTERILFVDDEETLVELGETMLETLGYTVSGATNSTEALEHFRENPDQFDLVITDLTMPQMTGDQLARELLRIRPDIPIILCTGFSASVDEKAAISMGIKAFVNKPILLHQLSETVRKVLDTE